MSASGGRVAGASRIRNRRAFAALLFLFLPIAVVPRASVVVHEHAGGGHSHVHADGDVAGQPHRDVDDFARAYTHRHEHASDHTHQRHSHPHRHHHDAHAHPTSPASGSVLAQGHISGLHSHTQSPYLLCLPAVPHAGVVLVARQSDLPTAPQAPPSASLALPFARGPPATRSFPTSLIS